MTKRLTQRIDDETGGVLLLGMGWLMVCLLFIGVAISITGLYLQQRQVSDFAAGAATYTANRLASEGGIAGCGFGGNYNCKAQGGAGGGANKSPQEIAQEYVVALQTTRGADTSIQQLVVTPDTGIEAAGNGGSRVRVELSARVNPPLLAWLTRAFDGGIVVTAQSYSTQFEQAS